MAEDDTVHKVQLSSGIVERIDARLSYTEFESIDNYIEFIAEEVLNHVEESVEHEGEAVDEDVVQDRLESLGYLNE